MSSIICGKNIRKVVGQNFPTFITLYFSALLLFLTYFPLLTLSSLRSFYSQPFPSESLFDVRVIVRRVSPYHQWMWNGNVETLIKILLSCKNGRAKNKVFSPRAKKWYACCRTSPTVSACRDEKLRKDFVIDGISLMFCRKRVSK